MDTVVKNQMTLHRAFEQGHIDVVEQLLAAGAEINAKDRAGLTALHYAIRAGHDEVLCTLSTEGRMSTPGTGGTERHSMSRLNRMLAAVC